ncbi:hypothetical protein AAGG42_06390 [Stenotrophomonas maltophilia]|uniref:hypothetical protein n=1 Tax=Stenotrophomonas maltophilia TaxID=40324 RepID=UPI002A9CA894|nr:hypothetical protein [Stenotrophomonas maltophilia]
MSRATTFYVAKIMAHGRSRDLKAMLGLYLMVEKIQDNGQFAVIGTQMMHLCCWTTTKATAEGMKLAVEEEAIEPDSVPGEVVIQSSWPCDVSGWPSARSIDTPGIVHLPPDVMAELCRGPVGVNTTARGEDDSNGRA